jgi:glutamate-1-semialdehyde 2,1-aminomutase
VSTKIQLKTKSTNLSAQSAKRLEEVTPGGVNSSFRSFIEVGGHTIFFSHALGSKIFDIDGNTYIDYLGAWGPAILGYSHPEIVKKCQETLARGPVFGAPHLLEIELAELIVKNIPSIEQIRFVNSGTEAVMSAVRLARGATGREKIIIFSGSYHGHSDSVLASRVPAASAGITAGSCESTVLVEYNSVDALRKCFEAHKNQIAAVIVEPVAGSMGVVPPQPDYLQGMRDLCTANGSVLVFDEVLTGFRVAFGGAQSIYGVKPDLTCFGKALAGGMPVGAYGGKKELMNQLLPHGTVYQAGTFSGNPVTMAGGIATINLLSDSAIFEKLESLSSRFFGGLEQTINKLDIPVQLQRVGSMFAIIFAAEPVKNLEDSLTIDAKKYAQFFHYLLENGIYMPPSSVDAACLSAMHSEEEIDYTIEVCAKAFEKVFS